MGRTGRRGFDRRTGRRRGLEAWIGGLGLRSLALRPAVGHGLGDGAWGDRRWGLAWVGKLGRWNMSVVRELAGKLRDEGDEGGRRAREKKRIEEERRKKKSRREREKRKRIF